MISPTSAAEGKELESDYQEVVSLIANDDCEGLKRVELNDPYMKINFKYADANSMLSQSPPLVSVCLVYGAEKCFKYLKDKFGLNAKDLSDNNKLDNNGRTPLMYAAASGVLNLFKLVMQTYENCMKIVEKNHGAHVLHYAAKYNRINIVKYICMVLEKSDSVLHVTDKKVTPLMWACSNNAAEVITFFLIDNKQGINEVTSNNWTPLHFAVKSNCIEAVKHLLYSPDIKLIKEKNNNEDPIHFAIRLGYAEVLKTLVEYGFLVQEEDYIAHMKYSFETNFNYANNEKVPDDERRLECARVFITDERSLNEYGAVILKEALDDSYKKMTTGQQGAHSFGLKLFSLVCEEAGKHPDLIPAEKVMEYFDNGEKYEAQIKELRDKINAANNSSQTKTTTLDQSLAGLPEILVERVLKEVHKNMTEKFFPVGHVYISMTNVNPCSFFGGVWEQIYDRFLFCSDTSKVKGGSKTITTENIPNHMHKFIYYDNLPKDMNGNPDGAADSGNDRKYWRYGLETEMKEGVTESVGGGKDYMPPYITVYAWHRVK